MNTTQPRTLYRTRVESNEFSALGVYKGSWGWITDHPLSKSKSHTGAAFALYPDEIFGKGNKNVFVAVHILSDFLPQNNPLNN